MVRAIFPISVSPFRLWAVIVLISFSVYGIEAGCFAKGAAQPDSQDLSVGRAWSSLVPYLAVVVNAAVILYVGGQLLASTNVQVRRTEALCNLFQLASNGVARAERDAAISVGNGGHCFYELVQCSREVGQLLDSGKELAGDSREKTMSGLDVDYVRWKKCLSPDNFGTDTPFPSEGIAALRAESSRFCRALSRAVAAVLA